MASQKIYLSSETPWQALYTTSEGYVVYKTECPPSWTAEVKNIKILRALPPAFCYNGTNNVSFAALAEIQYHTFRTAQIRFYDGGKTQLASEFLRKKGLSFLGRWVHRLAHFDRPLWIIQKPSIHRTPWEGIYVENWINLMQGD